ncbi:MAG: DUF5683 domain-containing protein [Leptospiraceae bacterium]|nr:DUF5683 domain-containing protein [Leptospiraceae bacterium]
MKRIKLIPNKAFVGIILLLVISVSIHSDTISLKNGKVINNVKSTIEKSSVKVKYESGKIENILKSDIKSLRVLAVQWKPVAPTKPGTQGPSVEELSKEAEEEAERVAEASAKGSEFTPRPEEDEINPWGNFGLGLIPGYSGLYRTEETKTAITFTVLETIALLYAYDLYSAKKVNFGYSGLESGGAVVAGSLIPSNQGATGTVVTAFGIYNAETYVGFEGGLSGRNLVSPAQPSSSEKSLATQRNTAYGILGFLLLTDGIMSYFSADSWNEGTFAGESSPDFVRPTTAWSRTLRSTFLPGWGQIYGGDKWKGYSWMVGGIALLGNVGVKEAAVTGARTAYQKNPSIGGLLATATPNTNVFLAYSFSEPAYAKLRSAVQQRNLAWSLYGAFWAINLVDAYFFSGKEASEQKVTILPKFDYQPVAQVGNAITWEQYLEIQCKILF